MDKDEDMSHLRPFWVYIESHTITSYTLLNKTDTAHMITGDLANVINFGPDRWQN